MPIDRKTIADELAEGFALELAHQSKRRKKLIEGAIADAALDPHDLRLTTEQLRHAWGVAVERWRNAIRRIEERYGKGWLSPSAAAVRLDYLCVAYPNDPDFRWMADVLFMLGLPRGLIEREACGKDGLWNRKLRKTKSGQDEMELAALANWLFDHKEDDDRREQNRRYRDLMAANETLERLIRLDPSPEARDATAGRPIVHGPLKTNFPRVTDNNQRAAEAEGREPSEAENRAEGFRKVFRELRDLSNRNAAAELNKRGIKTAKGGKWSHGQVRRVRKRLGRP
jgi:hypothetical protein